MVFDLGNVLVEWDPRRLLSDAYIEQTHFFLWNAELDRGVPFEELVARMRDEFPHFADETQKFHDRWEETVGSPFADVLEMAAALRARGVRTYVLSNSSAETLPRSPVVQEILEQFDGALISGAVGLTKPDAAIFRFAEEVFGLDPSTTWFIDDSEVNVDGALAVGWNAIHFRSAAGLKADLVGAGLLLG